MLVEDFRTTTVFADMLPNGNEFWEHPIQFIGTILEVYKLHGEHISAQTAEKRRKNVEDVQKRAQYRKAHGLEENQGIFGWTAKSDAESLGPAIPTGDRIVNDNLVSGSRADEDDEPSPKSSVPIGEDKRASYVDFEGKKKPVKRWFGIWE